jgi:hypothetical protein
MMPELMSLTLFVGLIELFETRMLSATKAQVTLSLSQFCLVDHASIAQHGIWGPISDFGLQGSYGISVG